MPIAHLGTFLILGATMFLATINFFEQNFQLMFAYLTAGFSWIVVASYEYKERVFDRAIAALVEKYSKEEDQQ
jgi:hypothetical protein